MELTFAFCKTQFYNFCLLIVMFRLLIFTVIISITSDMTEQLNNNDKLFSMKFQPKTYRDYI